MLDSLVLDAGPLLTLPASQLMANAEKFYTTPGVRAELKDENVRNQLILWGDKLVVKQPAQKYIDLVWDFAKKSGDSTVLSINDIHIIALAAEVHDSTNGDDGMDRLRRFPGEVRPMDKIKKKEYWEMKEKERQERKDLPNEQVEEETTGPKFDDDGFEIVVKKKGKKKQLKTATAPPVASLELPVEESVETQPVEAESQAETEEETLDGNATTNTADITDDASLKAEYDPDDDDGEWITPDNLQEMTEKDANSHLDETNTPSLCAFSTGDYACQNVSLQMGIHLLNAMTGKQIRRVRNYMLRCHACFHMLPIPKDGTAKNFCPECGGATLRRIPVSVNAESGKITPHLSKNFQWHTRGNVYSMANPLSKRYQKKYGNKGFDHVKGNQTDFYAEDQKEYQKAVKTAQWQMRKHEKEMMEFISTGSAENVISPFASGGRTVKVKVGRGKYANMVRKKK
ncbi:rRNA-binding endoribonuclease [Martiniozyma asiatica (nom. inval.)]|nr:rRNA-binding endoribonuclease [Martiniozyma asiatica]